MNRAAVPLRPFSIFPLTIVVAVAAAALPPAEKLPLRQGAFQESAPNSDLMRLARALREGKSAAALAELGEFAERHSGSAAGARAALALGHFEYERKHYAEAKRWLPAGLKDPILRGYARYWLGQTELALKDPAAALEQLEAVRKDSPDSVAAELALEPLTAAALTLGKPQRALAALDAFPKADTKSGLILLRAQALEKAGKFTAAAKAYSAVYYKFPLSPTAATAGARLKDLERRLRAEFPAASMEARLSRAESFYEARKWKEAREEYSKIAARWKGEAREPAELRIAQCRAQRDKRPGALEKLKLANPQLEAERLYSVSQLQRVRKKETEMLRSIERVAKSFPQSEWAEEALASAGNYFWMKLDRPRAEESYRRLLKQFPGGKNALQAQWRVAWSEYLAGQAGAAAALEEHLEKFPGSTYTANALYWRGRLAERAGDFPLARSFYAKLQQAFPRGYFAAQAGERMGALGGEPKKASEVLARVQAPAALRFDAGVPPAARKAWEHAQALHEIGFDASEELELRAAYAATPAPRLLLEVAKSALESGRFLPAIAAARQAVPQIEARRLEDIPEEVWRTLYPLLYRQGIEENAARAGLDPMMVAGLIRQESVFEAKAVSPAGARGLMQVFPPTGRQVARQQKLKYSKAKLFVPEFNLRLGTVYLARLYQNLGGWEPALAAYNAGESRVAQWQAERKFNEPAEFVESIPITETREYVQIVMRNAEIYRALYGRRLSAKGAGSVTK